MEEGSAKHILIRQNMNIWAIMYVITHKGGANNFFHVLEGAAKDFLDDEEGGTRF